MSSQDPFDAMFDYNDAAYTDLIDEANKDNRLGDHEFMVSEVSRGNFPSSGEPYLKVRGVLTTANSAKTDWTFSPPPPPEAVAAGKTSWEKGKQRGVANTVQMVRQLAEHYGVTPAKIKVGDTYKVKTGKRMDKNDRSSYFIQIIAFLPKDHAVGASNGTAPSTPTINVGF